MQNCESLIMIHKQLFESLSITQELRIKPITDTPAEPNKNR